MLKCYFTIEIVTFHDRKTFQEPLELIVTFSRKSIFSQNKNTPQT